MNRGPPLMAVMLLTLLAIAISRAATGPDILAADPAGWPRPGDTMAVSLGARGEGEDGRRKLTLTPEAAKVFRISGLLAPGSLVRIRDGGRDVLARGPQIVSDGVRVRTHPDSSRGPGDSVRTIPWTRIERLELGHRGWRKGVAWGAKIGATPGAALVLAAFDDPSPLSPLAVALGLPLLVAGGLAGATVGAAIGAGIKTWEPIYVAPQVWISSAPEIAPVRVVAVGPIHERSKPVLQRQKEVTAMAMDALRTSGFRMVEPDTVLRVVKAQLGRKRPSSDAKWLRTPEMRGALREHTSADAMLYGVVHSARRGDEVARWAFELSDLATGRILVTAEVAGRASFPIVAEEMARDALGHLGELRDTTRSRPDR